MSAIFNTMDFESAVGVRLKTFIETRLGELSVKLEDQQMDFASTQATRGAIKELRSLLRPAPQHVSTPRYGNMNFTEMRDKQ